MKIYNKKKFASGVFLLLLGLVRFTPLFAGREWDVKGVFWTAGGAFVGRVGTGAQPFLHADQKGPAGRTGRAQPPGGLESQKHDSEDHRYVCLVLGWIFLIMGVIRQADIVMAVGLGLLFTFPIGMFTELFTSIYYESKN